MLIIWEAKETLFDDQFVVDPDGELAHLSTRIGLHFDAGFLQKCRRTDGMSAIGESYLAVTYNDLFHLPTIFW